MKLILGNPGSGKTKELLRLSALNNIAILAENEARVTRLMEKANGYGYKIPRPITKEELNSVKEVYIDDVKLLLESLLNVKLSGLVVNNDEDLEVLELK